MIKTTKQLAGFWMAVAILPALAQGQKSEQDSIPISTSSASSSLDAAHGPEKACDGILASDDESNLWGSPNHKDVGSWWQADLGKVTAIPEVQVQFRVIQGRYYFAPKTITFQVSDDGETWSTVLGKSDNTPGPNSASTGKRHAYAINAKGRFLRLLFEEGTDTIIGEYKLVELVEVNVMNEASADGEVIRKDESRQQAAAAALAYHPSVPAPTFGNIPYGTHERQVLDFWKAESDTPTPLVVVIHGGAWQGGRKEKRIEECCNVAALLKAGISVAAINYRLITPGMDVEPPVKAPLHDAARALQFVRSKAKEWNIDKTRVGAAGESAGACSALWLAYHDDLADPGSDDPVLRESTRLACVAVMGPQTSLDPKQLKEWTPNSGYGGHAFGKGSFAQFLADRESILPWIAEYSPYALVSADDPPVWTFFGLPPALGEIQRDPIHTANSGAGLQKRCAEVGIKCDVVYPGAPSAKFNNPTDYLIATLKSNQE